MRFLTRIKETGWFYDGNRSTSKTNKDIKLNPKIGFYGHLKKIIHKCIKNLLQSHELEQNQRKLKNQQPLIKNSIKKS